MKKKHINDTNHSQSIEHRPPIMVVYKTSRTVAPQPVRNIHIRQSHPETHIINQTGNTTFKYNIHIKLAAHYISILYLFVYIHIYMRISINS